MTSITAFRLSIGDADIGESLDSKPRHAAVHQDRLEDEWH